MITTACTSLPFTRQCQIHLTLMHPRTHAPTPIALENKAITSLESCTELCSANPDCSAVQYHRSDQTCALMSGYVGSTNVYPHCMCMVRNPKSQCTYNCLQRSSPLLSMLTIVAFSSILVLLRKISAFFFINFLGRVIFFCSISSLLLFQTIADLSGTVHRVPSRWQQQRWSPYKRRYRWTCRE